MVYISKNQGNSNLSSLMSKTINPAFSYHDIHVQIFEIKCTDFIQKRKEAKFWNDYIVDIAGLFCPESKHVLCFIFHQNQRYMFQSIFSLERQTSCNSLLLFVMINKWGDMCHFQFQSLWRGGALHQVFLTHKGFRLPHLAGSASPSQGPHTCAMLHYWPI